MNSQDFQILKYIFNQGGQIKIQLIALKNNVSTDYTYLICRSLERAGHISLIRSNLCHLTSKGLDFIKKDSEKTESINNFWSSEGLDTKNINNRETDSDNGGLIFNLIKAGYKTVADLASAPLAKLTQNFNISVKKSAELINRARKRLRNSDDAHESLENVLK